MILLSLLYTQPPSPDDPRMTPEERARLLTLLEDSRKAFLSAISGLSGLQWKWTPAPDRWSIGEIAKHIVLSEALLFGTVKKAVASPANPDWEENTQGKTARLESVLAPRRGKAQSPEAIAPKGEMTLAQVKERFEEQRIQIVKFATGTDVALKQHTLDNPFFGSLNGYQWLIYVPLHTMRHDKQIAEVKATAGYS